MKIINTIGVVGAGTMGSAIAQKFAQEGFRVILADTNLSLAEKGVARIRTSFNEGVEQNIFTPHQVDLFLSNLEITERLQDLVQCDFVIEAVYESFIVKSDLFNSINEFVTDDCIIATNTSSFSVSALGKSVKHPERFIGLHMFYHAAKNRLVEIIPGDKTTSGTIDSVKKLCVLIGKDPIMCKDANGFAVNRFFVPWLNEATRLLQENVATIEEIDLECRKIFGIGMGPFALMNATGVSVAFHAEKTLEVFGKLYEVAPVLQQQAESGRLWEINPDLIIIENEEKEKLIHDRLLGIVFFVCSQILEEKVCSASDLDRGAKIGLRWKKGPVELMKLFGVVEVRRLVKLIADLYSMKLPGSIRDRYWNTESVKFEKHNGIAIITMDQPEHLNALSEESFLQLSQKFQIAESDPEVNTIFITGSGKAFVAGADIKFFVKNICSHKISDIEAFTDFGQKLFNRIDHSKKRVVAIINGLAFGGGLELALCADVILALPKAQLAFPETGIGIYPGLGGTQRSVKRIGKGLSKYLIHTGKVISATEAEEIGLIDKVISYYEMFDILSGERSLPSLKKTVLTGRWKKIKNFFEENSLIEILNNNSSDHTLPKEEALKIVKMISHKAPVALKLADKLIEEEKGCESELKHLREVFSTSDALLGLTSVGKKVEYSGR